MTERQMFEASYFKLSEREQWAIDANLGILDWEGSGLSKEDIERFHKHYEK